MIIAVHHIYTTLKPTLQQGILFVIADHLGDFDVIYKHVENAYIFPDR